MTKAKIDLVSAVTERAKNMRRHVLTMASGRGEGYVGQGLGAADIVAAVYFGDFRTNPLDPSDPDRDRFLLSVGHYSVVLFAALVELGVLGIDELNTYGAD
ncbi:MAG: transketolase, partial [Acidimicrobiales bacterium]